MTDKDESFVDMNTSIPDAEGDYVVDLSQDLQLKVVFAGELVIDGELVKYDDHIKLSQAGFNLKMTAYQLACLVRALEHSDNKKELKKRFKEEMKELQGVGF